MVWLVNELGNRRLGLIEDQSAEVVDPFHHKGWMSEVIVRNSTDKGKPGP